MKQKISKKIFLLTVILTFSFILASYNFMLQGDPPYEDRLYCEYDIFYIYNTSHERFSIYVSENLDYEDIFNLPRYNTSGGRDIKFDIPNYIDEKVISDYTEIYDNISKDYDKFLEYKAKAIQFRNSTVNYSIEYPSKKAWENYVDKVGVYRIEVQYGNNLTYLYEGNTSTIHRNLNYTFLTNPIKYPIIIMNSSGNFKFLNNSQSLTFSISDGFIIEMSLHFLYLVDKKLPPVGQGMDTEQIIILDNNYNPFCVFQINKDYYQIW
jgi:hypothetical protein